MTIFDHTILGGALIALSTALTWVMLRIQILDIPNQRSSHERPIPSSGGLSIVLTTYAGMLIAYLSGSFSPITDRPLAGLGLAALILVIAGFADDLGVLRTFKSKLAAQFVACCLLLVFDIRIENLNLPFLGTLSLGAWCYPVTVVWVLGLTNIYNFMDGLDGLAAGTGVLVSACFGLIAFRYSAVFPYVLCYVIFSATVGFFVFNFPRARIFMGDVGSQFLGFVFAALAILSADHDGGNISFFVMPLLFFHFIYDAVFTFFRRLAAGENVTQAHKGHLYQLLNQLGFSHPQVSLLHCAMVLWQSAGAIVMTRVGVSEPAVVFLPYLILQSIYAWFVVHTARHRGLI